MGISSILKMFGNHPDVTVEAVPTAPKFRLSGSLLVAYRKKRKKAKKVAYASKRTNMLRK